MGALALALALALTFAVIGILNIVCFIIGVRVWQKVAKDEKIELPNLNPLKAVRENRVKQEMQRKQEKRDKILRNIERYDGTGRGQEDVG